jgi:hypothetical protein
MAPGRNAVVASRGNPKRLTLPNVVLVLVGGGLALVIDHEGEVK